MLDKKYGFWTTVAMVIGVVIGSGVFFKADNILMASGGNVKIALLAWVYANYTSVLFNLSDNFVWIMAVVYMIGIYILNYLSPILSGKFQVTSTAIKLIPLTIIAIFGIFRGLSNGLLVENFSMVTNTVASGHGFAAAVLGTAFAYEGWIIATTINSEIKDSKNTLPKALVFGSLAIVVIYILYFIGIVGIIPAETILKQGDNAVNIAASTVFGNFGASVLTVFIIISCLGTLNGLILGGSRSFYSLAIRGQGIKPDVFSKVNSKTNLPTNSTIANFLLICIYLIVWYMNFAGLFSNGMFIDISELPIALIYAIYIVIYIAYMFKMKDLSTMKRFVIPALALMGALIVVYGGLSKPSVKIDLAISIFVFLSGLLFYKKK